MYEASTTRTYQSENHSAPIYIESKRSAGENKNALIPSHAKKPPRVPNLPNQSNAVFAPLRMVKNAKKGKQLVASTAVRGRPFFVQYVKIFGAWPRRARP